MILNISGRTDIVAFYSNWLLKRIKEGFVDVRNPFYPQQVSRIYFDSVEAIVFCTKNPIPILKDLDKIPVPYLFQITITPYHNDVEVGVGNKILILKAVKEIAKKIGKDRIYIRYDPILLSKKYSLSYHKKAFATLCKKLQGSTSHIIISFLDEYKNVKKHKKELELMDISEKDIEEIGKSFAEIAHQYHMTIQTCSEERNLVEYGFENRDCFDNILAYQLTGRKNFKRWKARNNEFCHCVEMVDIGVYNTCRHYCKYCYANFSEELIESNSKLHDENSTMLIGKLKEDDMIKVRKK